MALNDKVKKKGSVAGKLRRKTNLRKVRGSVPSYDDHMFNLDNDVKRKLAGRCRQHLHAAEDPEDIEAFVSHMKLIDDDSRPMFRAIFEACDPGKKEILEPRSLVGFPRRMQQEAGHPFLQLVIKKSDSVFSLFLPLRFTALHTLACSCVWCGCWSSIPTSWVSGGSFALADWIGWTLLLCHVCVRAWMQAVALGLVTETDADTFLESGLLIDALNTTQTGGCLDGSNGVSFEEFLVLASLAISTKLGKPTKAQKLRRASSMASLTEDAPVSEKRRYTLGRQLVSKIQSAKKLYYVCDMGRDGKVGIDSILEEMEAGKQNKPTIHIDRPERCACAYHRLR